MIQRSWVLHAVKGIFSRKEALLLALQQLNAELGRLWQRAPDSGLCWEARKRVALLEGPAVLIAVARADCRQLLVLPPERSLSSAPMYDNMQRSADEPSHSVVSSWESSSNPTGSQDCVLVPGLHDPHSTLRVVFCGSVRVTCLVPCSPSKVPWALIFGEVVTAVCTRTVTWPKSLLWSD